MWLHSLAQCQRYKGYISSTSVHRAGLSAPFRDCSCLVVFIQRAPGSHSTGLLSVSSSPPALELLLPAPVYSALLSKPHLNKLTQQLIIAKKESQEKACSSCCDVSGPFGVKECFSLTDQQTGSAVWDAVGPNAHKMSLFQCSGSYLIQFTFGIV